MTINVKRLSEKAVLPIKATTGSAAYDLTCTDISTEINEAGELILVYHTDLSIEIPDGYFGLLCMRSSIYKKTQVLCNAVGIIDSDFRGEITGKFRATVPVVPSVYKPQERFAQLLILPVPGVQFEESETLSETDRGEGGFGSTNNIDESADTPLQQEDSVIDAKDDATSAEPVASDQAAEPIEGSEGVQ